MTTLESQDRPRDRRLARGSGPARVDAEAKVRGAVKFAADRTEQNTAYAVLAVSTINRGRINRLDIDAARAVPGVRLVLTPGDLRDVPSAGFSFAGGYAGQSLQPMTDFEIAYRGQPIACVVADTFEAATEGASLVRADYSTRPSAVTLDAKRATRLDQSRPPVEIPSPSVGNPERALARGAATVDEVYDSPPQHNNPMELIATVAEWRDGNLHIHECTQNTGAVQHGLARQLRISPERIRVSSPYIGGSFGQKGFLLSHTVIMAIAARQLRRPVKMVMTRQQIFNATTFRPTNRHRIRLGAARKGGITAAIHESESQTSRFDLFATFYGDMTSRLYGVPNYRAREILVRNDVQTPGYMRAPFDHAGAFAFESAVDELAIALKRDPVELRLASDTSEDAITGKPLSSRHLNECLRRGARQFGWRRRNPVPGSMRASDGSLIGWGVAAGAYGNAIAPAVARIRANDEGDIVVSTGTHEMGQGARNAVAAAAADVLQVPVSSITTQVGDTAGPPLHLTAGSWGTATAVPAVTNAARELLADLRRLDPRAGRGRTPAQVLRSAGRPSLSTEARTLAPGQDRSAFNDLRDGLFAAVGPEFDEFVSFSYIAHFVEVRVEPTTRRIRVPRVVTVVDCGRVLSPRTAGSQVRGGVIWGIGGALREISEVDERYGGFLNNDIAEYVIPCHADIGDISVDFIDEPDNVLTPTGVKSLGEVVMVGVAPAITNAIHHATGRRFRNLPVRTDDLFD